MFLKIKSQLDVDKKNINGTKRNDSMHVYHQSTCTLLKNNFSSTLAHGRRRSHTVGHGCTSSHRYFAQKLPYTVEHGRIYDRTRSNTVAQNLFLPHTVAQTTVHGRARSHMVAHGRTDDRTWSHTVAQKILSCQNGLPSCYGEIPKSNLR